MTILLTTEPKFAAMDFAALASCISMAGGLVLSCERIVEGYKVEVQGIDFQAVKDCGRHLEVSEIKG